MNSIFPLVQQLPFKHFKIPADGKIEWRSLQSTDHLVRLPEVWIADKLLVNPVGPVGRQLLVGGHVDDGRHAHTPEVRIGIVHPVIFPKVRESDDLPEVIDIPGVGADPDLDAVEINLRERADIGQPDHGPFKRISEIMAQEIMLVFIVLVPRDFKILKEGTPLEVDPLLLGPRLGSYTGKSKMAKLSFRFDPEEFLSPLDQAGPQRKADITCINFFDDFIFTELITVVIQFHHIVEIKSGLAVVTGIEVEFFTNLALEVHLDVHVKVKIGLPLLPDGQGRVFYILIIGSEREIDVALGFDFNGIASKEAVDQCFLDINFLHGVPAGGLTPGRTSGEFVEIILLKLFVFVPNVFLKGHGTGTDVFGTDPFGEDVPVGLRIIPNFFFYGCRVPEIDGVLFILGKADFLSGGGVLNLR